jgi:YD repeat-containing protein
VSPPVGGNVSRPTMSQRGIPRRQFLSSALAGLGAAFLTGAALESPQQAQALSTGSPPLPPTPGPARPWHPPAGLGIGHTNTTQYGMDSQGQVLGVVDALGNPTNFSYDSNHNRLSTTVPSGWVGR